MNNNYKNGLRLHLSFLMVFFSQQTSSPSAFNWFRVHTLYQPFDPSGSTLPPAKGFVLFRAYNDFVDYQIALLEMFPREAGREGRHPRIIPFLPGPTNEVNDALSAIRQQELDDYLRRLCYLNRTTARYILEHNLTRESHALKPGDVERDTEPQYDRMADVGRYDPSEEPVPVSINDPDTYYKHYPR